MKGNVEFTDPEDSASSLDGLSVPALSSEGLGGLIDLVVGVDRMIASLHGIRAELIDNTRQWSEMSVGAITRTDDRGWTPRVVARRELVTELACALRLPERTTDELIATSESLMHELPETLGALRTGEISYRHAQKVFKHALTLPEETRGAFEAAVLPYAKKLTVSKFDGKARVVRERAHPESLAVRHAISVADRTVEFSPDLDGMAWLSAYLPAPEALGIYNLVTDAAIALQGPDETRTLTQLRADVFADLFLDSPSLDGEPRPAAPIERGIRARVLVTVPVLTLLGVSEEPASLEGYGPIDADTARRIAAKAPGFTRILTHPETGAVLSVGKTRYSVPKDLRTWLRVRDETCRFPGCHRNAARSEIDHTVDWQYGGGTNYDNLAHLCPAHHNVKHHTSWTVRHQPDGVLDWKSPAGFHYDTEPAIRIRPGPNSA
jgi:Domain of unknown function (DUF222)